jgi:hypothetical protein
LAHKLEHALHVKMMLTYTSFHWAYKLDHVLHVKMMPTCTSFHLSHKLEHALHVKMMPTFTSFHLACPTDLFAYFVCITQCRSKDLPPLKTKLPNIQLSIIGLLVLNPPLALDQV